MIKLYSWKDVERHILMNKECWKQFINNIEVYSKVMVVNIENDTFKECAEEAIAKLFQEKYDQQNSNVVLDLGESRFIKVEYEIDNTKYNEHIVPLFSNILYKKSAYLENIDAYGELKGSQLIAFHSYKGGVGRTLSLLAFVKAWTYTNPEKYTSKQRLLIVDSDLEAPGLTWLQGKNKEHNFSYIDLLALIHEENDQEEIVELAFQKIDTMFKISTENFETEHFFLPTYRYEEQLLDMYNDPEKIAESYKKEFAIAEVLSKLGAKLEVSAVIIDLRAGLSEFSAPILFDPRVKKYVVTSTSSQSIMGTEIILRQLNKGLAIDDNTIMPEIFLTMVQDTMDVDELNEIISKLVCHFSRENSDDDDDSLTDNIITRIPFASELIHLGTLEQIMHKLEGREIYKIMLKIMKDNYFYNKDTSDFTSTSNREITLNKIHDLAKKQITAESNEDFKLLLTESLKNLTKKFSDAIPVTVIMGAKGAGKTYLYRELLKKKTWSNFVASVDMSAVDTNDLFFIPILASKNANSIDNYIQDCITNANEKIGNIKISESIYLENSEKIIKFNKNKYDELEWKRFWDELLATSFGEKYETLENLNTELISKNKKIVFILDGIEEILLDTLTSSSEQKAIIALCQNITSYIATKYKNIGIIIFLRTDLARDSIKINFEQFNQAYSSVELKWSRTEALRLALWLVYQAVPDFYKDAIPIEKATMEKIEISLQDLWGLKLGKSSSNEAYSSRWILAALSDFNGQLQARDIIRFLQFATENSGNQIYNDRVIMPAEIRKAVPKCSTMKIDEIKQEIGALKPILEKLEDISTNEKLLPFNYDNIALNPQEIKIMTQEGYLKLDNNKYYLPEIIRHALEFKYEKGARPKVLSLLLSK